MRHGPQLQLRRGSRSRRLGLAVASCAWAITSTACTTLRDFIIPPPSIAPHRGPGQSRAPLAGVVEGVALAGAATTTTLAWDGRALVSVQGQPPADRFDALTEVIDGRGLIASRPFVDAHVHLTGAAMLHDAVLIPTRAGPTSADGSAVDRAQLEVMLRHAPRIAPWRWLVGGDAVFAASLDAASLQALAPQTPLWLSRADGHGAIASTALIALLPPALGSRAAAQRGRLDGALARAAWRALPLPHPDRLEAMIVRTLRAYAAEGIGEVHTMGESVAALRLLRRLDEARRLPIRVVAYVDLEDDQALAALTEGSAAAPSRRSLLVLRGGKVWLDGTLGASTAALTAAYADGAAPAAPAVDDAQLRRWLERLDALGGQLAVHAIGDAAVATVARVVAGASRPATAWPLRVEHAQVVAPEQISALRGLECSIQPLHRLEDAAFASARLGPSRWSWAYRAATLRPCVLRLGSDHPVSVASPRQMIQDLVGEGPDPRPVVERLSFDDALVAATRPSTAGAGHRVADFRTGEPADLMLWRREGDVIHVMALWVGGQLVFRSVDLLIRRGQMR